MSLQLRVGNPKLRPRCLHVIIRMGMRRSRDETKPRTYDHALLPTTTAMAPIRTVGPFARHTTPVLTGNHSNGHASFALSPQRHPRCTSANPSTPTLMASRLCSGLVVTHPPTVGLAAWNKQPIKAHEIIGSALDPAAQVTNTVLTVKELLAPLSREELKVVRCLGLNYSDHAVCAFSARFCSSD